MSRGTVVFAVIISAMVLMQPGQADAVNCAKQPGLCCFNKTLDDPTVCSGHGQCSGFDKCTCNVGWDGAMCENESRCGGTDCPYQCNGGGLCMKTSQPDPFHPYYECLCYGLAAAGRCCEARMLPTLAPASLDFGSVSVGGASLPQTLTVINLLAITMDTISLSGDNSADFSLGGTCANGASISGGTNCTVTIVLTPSGPGPRTATLTITTTSPATTLTTSLTGTGTIAATSIIIDPNPPATLYAGLDGAGVFKSTESDTNWSPANGAGLNNLTNLRVKALARTMAGTIYAATYGGGVFKTADGGSNWAACNTATMTNLNVVSLTIDGSGKLYAGTEAGVFMSSNNCATWNEMNNGLPN